MIRFDAIHIQKVKEIADHTQLSFDELWLKLQAISAKAVLIGLFEEIHCSFDEIDTYQFNDDGSVLVTFLDVNMNRHNNPYLYSEVLLTQNEIIQPVDVSISNRIILREEKLRKINEHRESLRNKELEEQAAQEVKDAEDYNLYLTLKKKFENE